ncbi:MAG: rod shape-determining protein MreC [bacterium]|nr:MAG: rod shape-determining protein MreC [bacterium]
MLADSALNILFGIDMAFHRNISGYRGYLLHAALVLISLILISSNQNRQIESFKMWMVGVLCSVQEKWDSFQTYLNLKQKNKQLRLENTKLALENSFMYEMRLENERLRELIRFKETNELQLIAARVIVSGAKGIINGIVLNVGMKDSIAKSMPLVVANGLVGKIYQVGKNHSIGHLLLDRNFRVSAKIQRSRVKGIVSWEGGDFCLLNNVPKRSDVKIGDLVITSGYGEIFPSGLIIGHVINITESPRGLFMDIKVKPTVNFEKLEEVFIVVEQRTDLISNN